MCFRYGSNDKKRHSIEAQEWCFHLMNDPEHFEKWRT
jgi:hypothetical protein